MYIYYSTLGAFNWASTLTDSIMNEGITRRELHDLSMNVRNRLLAILESPEVNVSRSNRRTVAPVAPVAPVARS
jgi:hypothetical protein